MSKIYIVCKVEYEAVILWWAGRSKKKVVTLVTKKSPAKKGWHPGINSKLLTGDHFRSCCQNTKNSSKQIQSGRGVCALFRHFLKIVILFNRTSTRQRNIWRRAISGILTRLGWFDPLMGRVHQPKQFWSGVNPVGVGAPPQIQRY